MMNLIALSLVATSLLVSGFFSPTPHSNNGVKGGEQVIVREGHRAVVVEYGDTAGDGNTKVSISPPEPTSGLGPYEDQLSRVAASVAGVAQDVKGKAKEAVSTGPRELICDAYGKCKHKVAGVLGRAKERAVEAEEAVGDAVEKARDFASRAAEGAEDAKENVKGKVKEAGEKVKETGEKMKGKTEEKVRETGEKAREMGEKVKETGHKVKGKAGEMAEETAEKVKETGRKGKKEFSDIAKRGKEVVSDVIGYVFGADAMGALMNLMGLAMAYGIGTWVTFISNHVLAGVLPRQQFGMVNSKIYPVYFKAMVGSIGLALLGHLLGHRGKVFKSKPEILQSYNLLSSLLFALANLLFLEPRATKAMFDRMKLEKEEGRGRDLTGAPTRVIDTVETVLTDSAGPVPNTATTAASTTTAAATTPPPRPEQDEARKKLARLDERLKKLNSYSSLLNIMTLMGLTWHLVYLSQRLGMHS